MPDVIRPTPFGLHRLAAVGGGLLGIAALAGCAPSAAAPPASAAAAPAASTSTPGSASTDGSSDSAGLKDGSYTASSDYQSPGGLASIDVTVTLADGTISAVEVVPKATNGTARQYESQFASGIDAVAVGKPIAGLKVGAVSGSSLTGQGFEKALQAIQEEAAA